MPTGGMGEKKTPPQKNSTSYIHPWKFNSEFTPEKMGGYIVVGRLLFSIGRQLFRGEMLNFRIKNIIPRYSIIWIQGEM